MDVAKTRGSAMSKPSGFSWQSMSVRDLHRSFSNISEHQATLDVSKREHIHRAYMGVSGSRHGSLGTHIWVILPLLLVIEDRGWDACISSMILSDTPSRSRVLWMRSGSVSWTNQEAQLSLRTVVSSWDADLFLLLRSFVCLMLFDFF